MGVVLQESGASPARVVVLDVVPGGPAQLGGLRSGDLVLKVGGEETPTIARLADRLRRCSPGETIDVLVRRQGGELVLPVRTQESPARERAGADEYRRLISAGEAPDSEGDPAEADAPGDVATIFLNAGDDAECDDCELPDEERDDLDWTVEAPGIESLYEMPRAWLGVSLLEMTSELRAHFGAPSASGVLVGQVRADGPAGRAGLAVGDVLVSLDGTPVEGSGRVPELLAAHRPGETVRAETVRDGKARTVPIELGTRPAAAAGEWADRTYVLKQLEKLPAGKIRFHAAGRRDERTQVEELLRQIDDLRRRLDALSERLDAGSTAP
jgi:predicted metalloprotease with PDZ domain